MNISKLSDEYSVSPQILADDVAALAKDGFVTVICNRPDDEDPGQPSAAEIAAACKKSGLSFHHIPFASMPITDEAIADHRQAIDDSDGPVFAYCRSGQRCALIWQACRNSPD